MPVWFAIGLAGALGALSRYGLSIWLNGRDSNVLFAGVSWPLPILLINALGCLLAGGVLGLLESRWSFSETTSLVIMIGFLGAFTTFSAFTVEILVILRSAGMVAALGNVLLHNLVTIFCAIAGYGFIRWLT